MTQCESRTINRSGIELIKRFEGLRLTSYKCPAGIWTIGYGHTGNVRAGIQITVARAEELLKQDLAEAGRQVERLVQVPLTDNQFAALVSFCFNVGAGALERSTLLRMLNDGDYDSVPSQLKRWTRGGGKVLPGLVKRRDAEADLWVQRDDGGAS